MFDQFTLPGFDGAPPGAPPTAKATEKSPRGRAPYALFFSIFPQADAAKVIAIQGAPLAHEHAVEPITWAAKEFFPINSHVGQGVHEVLGRWSLRA